jgi:hypothetical protein
MEGVEDRATSGRFVIWAGVAFLAVAALLSAVARFVVSNANSRRNLYEFGLAFVLFAAGYLVWGGIALARARKVTHESGGAPGQGR